MNHIKNHIKDHYTLIPNGLIRQEGLNSIAKYIYCYLASMSDGWNFKTDDLVNRLAMNKKTYIKYRDQLVENGWLFIEPQKTGTNGFFLPKVYHILCKEPCETPEKPTENHLAVGPSHPPTTSSAADDFRDGRNGSHKKKKLQEEKKIKEEKPFLKNDFKNFNPNPRLNKEDEEE